MIRHTANKPRRSDI